MKRKRSVFLFVLTLLLSLVVSPSTAKAVSDYDDVIWHQSPIWLPVYHYDTWDYTYRDVTASWYSLIPAGAAKTSLDYARNNGGHFMVVNGNDQLYVIWSTDPTVRTSFFQTYGQPSWGIAAGNEWHVTRLYEDSTGIVQTSYLNQSVKTTLLFGNKPNPLPTTPGGVVFSTYENNLPADYAGALLPSGPPAITYAGLGDSYTTAEGNGPFEYGTDVSGVNGCHRSPQAYPRLLQTRLTLGPTAFVACSGATTANVVGGQWNEPAQTSALSADTELVSLTIGGNDVGFGDYALGCTVACGPGTPVYTAIMAAIGAPAFKSNLVTTYKTVLNAAPNADLYVGDYPYISAVNATTCWGLDFSGARAVQIALNGVIRDAVEAVRDDTSFAHRWDIQLVPTNASASPFAGRHLCNGGDTDFHGLVAPPNVEYSLHPNASGQQHYADVFESAIS